VEWLELELVNKPKDIIEQENNIISLREKIKSISGKTMSPTLSSSKVRKIYKKRKKLKKQLATMETSLQNDLKRIRFKMKAENFSPNVSVKSHPLAPKIEFTCRMTQFPINLNDATTGHKLQGMSKDVIIITSWPKGGLSALFKNWEYVVLSRVRTLDGLYLFEPIDLEKSFKPSKEYRSFLVRAKQQEKSVLDNIKQLKMNLNSNTET
jgi:hypothetical protein